MVALSHNNKTLADLLGGGGPISGVFERPCRADRDDDRISERIQKRIRIEFPVARDPDVPRRIDLRARDAFERVALVASIRRYRVADFLAGVIEGFVADPSSVRVGSRDGNDAAPAAIIGRFAIATTVSTTSVTRALTARRARVASPERTRSRRRL